MCISSHLIATLLKLRRVIAVQPTGCMKYYKPFSKRTVFFLIIIYSQFFFITKMKNYRGQLEEEKPQQIWSVCFLVWQFVKIIPAK